MPNAIIDVLALYPGGYPLHIDMPEHAGAGAATGMRFTLPQRGLNLPLQHARESKLVVAQAAAPLRWPKQSISPRPVSLPRASS